MLHLIKISGMTQCYEYMKKMMLTSEQHQKQKEVSSCFAASQKSLQFLYFVTDQEWLPDPSYETVTQKKFQIQRNGCCLSKQ